MLDPFGAAAAVITAFTAVRWLYDHCSDPANAADQVVAKADPLRADRKCREFGTAITGLVRAIQNIEQDFENGWRDDHGSAANDARAIKYEFSGLLEECEQLLAKHAHLHYNGANILQNITWGANVQPRVDQLLTRIALQTQRATFIYSTLSYNRQEEIAAQMNHIMQVLDPTAPRARALDPNQYIIQPAIVNNFRRATCRKSPHGFQSPEIFPFQTGLNTLRSHLEQSTAQSGHGETQTIFQHISLLKAQWLLQTIKNLDHFKGLRPGAKARSEIQDLENQIVDELTRQDLTMYALDDLLSLPPNHFFIWETTPKNVPRNLLQPFQEEKQIIDMELPAPPNYQQCRLVVFRDLGHRQGTAIRLTRQWKRDGQLLPPYSNRVDAFTHTFRPLYALNASPDQHLSVEICNADGGQADVYQFKELKDLFKLQWALSNYNVFSDFEDIDWTITRSWKPNIHTKGSRIQIWWYDPDDDLEKMAAEVISPASRDSGRASILSTMTSAAGRSILESSGSQGPSSTSFHATNQSEIEVVEAIPPYEPLLVIFAWRERRYEFLSLNLHGQMYIDQSQCRCKKEENSCPRAVIRSCKEVNYQIKRTVPGLARPRDLPDLNIFARSYHKGKQQHPLMNSIESIETRELTLDFANAMQRRRFNQQFEFISKLQRSREGTHDLLLQRAISLQDKPRGMGNGRRRITGSIGTNGSLTGSVGRSLSHSSGPTIRTQSVLASPTESWEMVSTPPGSPKPSSFEGRHELSQINYM